MTSKPMEEDDLLGVRIAATVWVVVAVAVYLCGVLIPWDSMWLGFGVAMAPLYAGSLVLPVVYAFDTIDRRFLAVLWSLFYLGFYFSVAIRTGWWKEAATAMAAWPIFLPLGSAVVATIASAPFLAIAAIWDDFDITLPWPSKVKPRFGGSAPESVEQSANSTPVPIVHHQSTNKRRALKKFAGLIGLIASLLTIIGFILQYAL